MSGFFRAVGQVAGALAPIALLAFGPVGGAIAGAVAAVSTTVGALTARPPTQRGSVQGFMVGANQPLPYLIGESYFEGLELYRIGYGGRRDGVDNPYAFIPRVLSCCGPIEDMGPTVIGHQITALSGALGTVQSAVGYYNDWLFVDQQLGARPEADALQTPAGWGTPPLWSSNHKLSGFPAVGWSLRWSSKGKRFAGGTMPTLGKVPKGVKVYDRRLDSTAPGGLGPCRLGDESTYVYSRNPACHAATYAYGRIMNGEPIFGVRLFEEAGINWDKVVAWSNVCDANNWTANGVIFEPADKWNNLKLICEAGAGQPVPGSVLDFDYQAPRIPVYTVTRDDLAGPINSALGKGWRVRKNVLVPRFRSPAHRWDYIQAGRVQNDDWIAADGEEKIGERLWQLVTNANQATELATYDLWQQREAGPISLICKPHMRFCRPGQALVLAEELGVHPSGEIKVVIRRVSPDLMTGEVRLLCEMETDAKHVAALGLMGTIQEVVDFPTAEERDAVVARNLGFNTLSLASSYTRGLAGNITQVALPDDEVEITIPAHVRIYANGLEVAVDGGVLVRPQETNLFIYYDDEDRAGGAVSYQTTTNSAEAYFSESFPDRHFIAFVGTVNAGGEGGTTIGSGPSGGGGWGSDIPNVIVP